MRETHELEEALHLSLIHICGAWPRRAEQRHGAEHVSGRACAGTGVLEGRPVSYTHLDVYKRQRHTHLPGAFLLRQAQKVDQADGLVFIYCQDDVFGRRAVQRAKACLLYTSRCV